MKTLCCQNKTKRSKKECVLSNSNIGIFFHKIIMSECGCLEKWNFIGLCSFMRKAWRMLLCRTRVKTIFPFLLTLSKISSLIPTLNWAKIKKRGTHPLILVSIPTWIFPDFQKRRDPPPSIWYQYQLDFLKFEKKIDTTPRALGLLSGCWPPWWKAQTSILFSRALWWYKWLRILIFLIFCQFSPALLGLELFEKILLALD